jgi:hypothetical protein
MASLVAGSLVAATGGAAMATGGSGQVCEGLDSGKIDLTGENETHTVSAPDGKLIDGYCVKAGSANAGDGPRYVDIDPVESLTLTHPSGKAISHYSLSYTEADSTGDEPEAKPEDEVEELDESRTTCEGVERREGTKTTTYTFDSEKDEWVPVEGEPTWEDWEKVRDLTEEERKKLDCDEGEDDKDDQDGSTVTPVAPSVSQSEECDVEGTFTIPRTKGVRYLLDGEPIKPGEHTGPVDGELTAVALGEYELKNPDWSYDLVVDEAVECDDDGTAGGGDVVAPTVNGGVDRCPNIEGKQTTVPAGYSMVDGECARDEVMGVSAAQPPAQQGGSSVVPDQVPDQVLGVQESLPTTVNAGLGATSQRGVSSLLAPGMITGGLLLMVMAAALRTRRQELGAHEG